MRTLAAIGESTPRLALSASESSECSELLDDVLEESGLDSFFVFFEVLSVRLRRRIPAFVNFLADTARVELVAILIGGL